MQSGGNLATLSSFEPSFGGCTNFMSGAKYNRCFPRNIIEMSFGLSIYHSYFSNASGGYGGGEGTPEIFTEIDRYHNFNNTEFVSS